MVPPDTTPSETGRAKRLPTLSWTSVVDDDMPASPEPADVAPTSPATPLAAPVIAAPQTSDEVQRAEPADVVLQPMTLSLGSESAVESPATPSTEPSIGASAVPSFEMSLGSPATPSLEPSLGTGVEQALAPLAPVAPIEPIAEPTPIVFEPMQIVPGAIDPVPSMRLPAIRPFAPKPITPIEPIAPTVSERTVDAPAVPEPAVSEPAIVDPTPEPLVPTPDPVAATPSDVAARAVEESPPLPVIREATPVEPMAIETTQQPVVVPSPTLPSAVPPEQQQRPAAVAPVGVYADITQPEVRPARRSSSKSGRGLKLVLVLVVLCGLVATAVVFGRPYLFPDDWDPTTEPYALAVEEARGVEFVEPLEIVSEDGVAVAARAAADMRDGADIATWRALGLATGAADVAALGAALEPSTIVHYSPADGQLYAASGADGAAVDAALTRALAVAALDQDFAWSADQATRGLDAAALTAAEVHRQARQIQQDSSFDADPPAIDVTPFATLAPVDAYRLLGPLVFAEFGPTGDGDNPLADLGPDGPGPLAVDALVAAPAPELADGDVAVGEAMVMDRAFWYLVLAAYVDGPTAHAASEAIVEATLTTADRGTTRCVYATFAGTDVEGTPTLRDALTRWSETAPIESAATFGVLDDGTLQLAACDPGAGFQAPVRTTAARELVAWRAAELATVEAIDELGSTDPAGDFAFAWPFVAGSGVVDEMVALPDGATPAEIADTARAGVARVLTPAG